MILIVWKCEMRMHVVDTHRFIAVGLREARRM